MKAPLPEPTMRAFRDAAHTFFQPFSCELDSNWHVVTPWIEGFSTPTVKVTIGVYHGHFPSVVVKLRPDLPPAPLGTEDKNMFGLDWIEVFVRGHPSPISPDERWTPKTIKTKVESLAAQFREFAMPLLEAPDTDWTVIQLFVRERIQASVSEYKRFTATPHV